MDNYEVVDVTFEEVLSSALQENGEYVKLAAPGTEERERLVKERDMLMKLWLELDKQKSDLEAKVEPKWKKILDGVKTGADIAVKVFQVGGSLAIAIGVIKLGNRDGFLSADDFKGLSMVERLLVK